MLSSSTAAHSPGSAGTPHGGGDAGVAAWLFGCAGLVATTVGVGGLTRLTRSGLSMTDWTIHGGLPPLTRAAWEAEFERYRRFPEAQQRQGMTLDEFKVIYAWEYAHRMLGRVIGACFVVPAVYFGLAGRLAPHPWLRPRLAALFGLGAAQGLIGWWMVRSGLDVRTSSAFGDPRKEIRVSPYRLATHLTMALATYAGLVWTALDVLAGGPAAARATTQGGGAGGLVVALPRVARFATAAVFAAAVSGAFVAGNDAGRAYNTFPAMVDDAPWGLPSHEELAPLTPVYRNFFESTATVQLDHRLLAATATGLVAAQTGLGVASWARLPDSRTRLGVAATAAALAGQVSLGIATLLLYVPIPLAAAHQLGSIALLTASLVTTHGLVTTGSATAARAAVSAAASSSSAALASSRRGAALASSS